MDLTEYIHRVFYPNTQEYTFCWAPHGSFSKIDPIVKNNSNLYRFKRFWKHSLHLIWPQCNKHLNWQQTNLALKHTNSWRLCNSLLSGGQVKQETKKDIQTSPGPTTPGAQWKQFCQGNVWLCACSYLNKKRAPVHVCSRRPESLKDLAFQIQPNNQN